VKKTACDIRCDNFVMLGRMEEGGGSRGDYASRSGERPADRAPAAHHDYEDMPPAPASSGGGGFDDDIPF
jgi:hypothetical protein